jgi:hypothetical protein
MMVLQYLAISFAPLFFFFLLHTFFLNSFFFGRRNQRLKKHGENLRDYGYYSIFCETMALYLEHVSRLVAFDHFYILFVKIWILALAWWWNTCETDENIKFTLCEINHFDLKEM